MSGSKNDRQKKFSFALQKGNRSAKKLYLANRIRVGEYAGSGNYVGTHKHQRIKKGGILVTSSWCVEMFSFLHSIGGGNMSEVRQGFGPFPLDGFARLVAKCDAIFACSSD